MPTETKSQPQVGTRNFTPNSEIDIAYRIRYMALDESLASLEEKYELIKKVINVNKKNRCV